MCQVLKVSPSGYYAWACRAVSARDQSEGALLRQIEQAFSASHGSYGSPRIFAVLRHNGYSGSRSRIERLMRKYGLRAKGKKRFRVATTNSSHGRPVAPNHVAQDFNPERLNQVWASDVTYIDTAVGWLYLAVIIDLHSRAVVGWSMEGRQSQDMIIAALKMAINRRNPGTGLMFHSDRGSTYVGERFVKVLKLHHIQQSMSGTGNCYDNAAVESFFHTLKTEHIDGRQFTTRQEARDSLFEWMEITYNRKRLHSTLGYRTPENFELFGRR